MLDEAKIGELTFDEESVRRIVREEIERAMKKDPAARKACIVASKGTLDWACGPEPESGREQVRLPGLRAEREAEVEVARVALQPVGTGLLPVRPAARQLGRRLDLAVRDGTFPQHRCYHPVAAAAKRRHEVI